MILQIIFLVVTGRGEVAIMRPGPLELVPEPETGCGRPEWSCQPCGFPAYFVRAGLIRVAHGAYCAVLTTGLILKQILLWEYGVG